MHKKEIRILRISLEDYPNCSAIWDMDACPYTQTFIPQIRAGEREVYILKVNGAYIAECDLVYSNPEYGTVPGKRLYLSRLIVKKRRTRQGLWQGDFGIRNKHFDNTNDNSFSGVGLCTM